MKRLTLRRTVGPKITPMVNLTASRLRGVTLTKRCTMRIVTSISRRTTRLFLDFLLSFFLSK